MAAARRARCSTCGNENGQVTCEGCSKVFCLNDFTGHRQELDKQLEEIEVTRNLFRQTLTEKISQPENHVLIEQIDKWEKESVIKIRQTAEEARRILLKHTAELNTKIENELNKLTNQLRQGRKKNEFSEPDLGEWREELTQMQNELDNPSNITVRQDRTPLVTNINVDISDDRHNMKQSGKTRVVMEDFNVCCSFCGEKFTSQKAMGDHLMMCGNKTDQCLNCRKYIRRAIFAYHTENNCANPDVPAADDYTEKTAQHSEKTRTSDICEYCHQNYDRADSKIHKKNCLRNPANRSKNQQSSKDVNFNQNSDRSRQSDDSNNNARILDEYRNEETPWHLYENHTEACRNEEHEPVGRGPRHASTDAVPATNIAVQTPSVTDNARCKFCEKLMSASGLRYHQLVCVKNTHRNKNYQ